jgi:adenylate cyclase
MSKALLACPACGAEVQPTDRFCASCAAPQPGTTAAPSAGVGLQVADLAVAAGLAEERRLVTVLFADVTGSTTLAERLDAEDMRGVLTAVFGALAREIQRFGGTVEKYIGDAVMAVFGYPAAHEDDAERAVRAALAMQVALEQLNIWLEREHGVRLALRIGVNSGTVVGGPLVTHSTDNAPGVAAAYTVVGDTVNTAQRLESEAVPGQVVIGAVTRRLVRDSFVVEELPPLTLKGKAEPVRAYRLVAHSEDAARVWGARFIGREQEITTLRAALDEIANGSGAVMVTVVGEAGLGKSRLIDEFKNSVQSRSIEFVTARCASFEQQTPYALLARLLRSAFGVSRSDPAEVVEQRLQDRFAGNGGSLDEVARAVLLEVLGYGRSGIDSDASRNLLVAVILRLIRLSTTAAPVVILAEDIHWSDPSSQGVLADVVAELGSAACLLIVTTRPEWTPPWRSRRLDLAPLGAAESKALLEQAFGGRVDAALAQELTARVSGNPFFLGELVAELRESNTIVQNEGVFGERPGSKLRIPETVEGVVTARLDRLSAALRRRLKVAAVIGATFPERLLEHLTRARELDADLIHLVELGFLEVVGTAQEKTFRFRHALIREIAYAQQLRAQRRRLHRQIGDAIVELYPERLDHLIDSLGYHYGQGDDDAKAQLYLLRAARRALHLYAAEEALAYFQAALERSPAAGAAEARAAALEGTGDVHRLRGLYAPASAAYHSALHELGDDQPNRIAGLHRKIGTVSWDSGDRDDALAHYQSGLTLLAGRPSSLELAELHQEMGRLRFRTGDNQDAVEFSERALSIVAELSTSTDDGSADLVAVSALAHNTIGVALAHQGQLERAVEHVERSRVTANAAQLSQLAARAQANLCVLYGLVDPARAIGTCLEGLEMAKKVGDVGLQSWLYANLAGAYCTFTAQCRDEGIAAAEAAIDLDRRLGHRDHLAVPLIILGQIHQCHGELVPSQASYEEALSLAEEMAEPQLIYHCHDGLASLYIAMGDDERAAQHMAKAQSVCMEWGLKPESLQVLPFLC